jgi:hypothetical protein
MDVLVIVVDTFVAVLLICGWINGGVQEIRRIRREGCPLSAARGFDVIRRKHHPHA